MIRFDWREFCRREHVQFVESGPNTARGNISIRCPFCGNADPSQHMGLSLNLREPYWGCLRNGSHAGRNPAYLIARLLGIAYKTAVDMVSGGGTPIDEYETAVNALKDGPEPPPVNAAPKSALVFPPEFKRLLPHAFKAERFIWYLANTRGFGEDAPQIALTWNLHYALTGDQTYRIIFPVQGKNGKILGWTGRSIAETPEVRYLTMPGMGKDVIYGYPNHMRRNRRVLIIVEGPMDALKLNAFGGKNIHAIATMGTSFTDGQTLTMLGILPWFDKTVIVGDETAIGEALMLSDQLSTFAGRLIPAIRLPEGYKDPGEMTKASIKSFCSKLIQ